MTVLSKLVGFARSSEASADAACFEGVIGFRTADMAGGIREKGVVRRKGQFSKSVSISMFFSARRVLALFFPSPRSLLLPSACSLTRKTSRPGNEKKSVTSNLSKRDSSRFDQADFTRSLIDLAWLNLGSLIVARTDSVATYPAQNRAPKSIPCLSSTPGAMTQSIAMRDSDLAVHSKDASLRLKMNHRRRVVEMSKRGKLPHR